MSHGQSYEIEIRFCVASPEEAYALLPFFEQSLRAPKKWATDIIGRELYESGRLLRLGRTLSADRTRYSIGYKGPDLGAVANIRQEWGEEITDGIQASAILTTLGLAADYPTRTAVVDALSAAGYTPFMNFAGVDRLGYYAPLDLHTKLCQCEAILDQQYLVELEMSAASLEEAWAAEARLQVIAEEYHLTERLFRDEPPTMLYQRTFG
ncbi:MAG: hypothetical protein DYG89_14545 [Caldilinea sp. CFX5]|nr:hypothetical protein [Caldilinea sp. CFX5]